MAANGAGGEVMVFAGVLSSFWRPRLAWFFGRRRFVRGSSSDESESSELLLPVCTRRSRRWSLVLPVGEMTRGVLGFLGLLGPDGSASSSARLLPVVMRQIIRHPRDSANLLEEPTS